MDKMNKTSMRGPERPVYLDASFAIADACVVECQGHLLENTASTAPQRRGGNEPPE